MKKNNIDYSIYLVTDRDLMSTDTLDKAVTEAILGGCTLVQLREKNVSSSEFYQMALAIKKITDTYNVPLIINDRIDIALAVGASGVHIGQSDIPANIARSLIGDKMVLGVSVSNTGEAEKAKSDGADYLGVGAMYPTDTKTDAKTVSLNELSAIRSITSLPIVVIGGINKTNAGIFKPLGIDGLAVVSAIISKPDIKAAAAEIKSIFNGRA